MAFVVVVWVFVKTHKNVSDNTDQCKNSLNIYFGTEETHCSLEGHTSLSEESSLLCIKGEGLSTISPQENCISTAY